MFGYTTIGVKDIEKAKHSIAIFLPNKARRWSSTLAVSRLSEQGVTSPCWQCAHLMTEMHLNLAMAQCWPLPRPQKTRLMHCMPRPFPLAHPMKASRGSAFLTGFMVLTRATLMATSSASTCSGEGRTPIAIDLHTDGGGQWPDPLTTARRERRKPRGASHNWLSTLAECQTSQARAMQ